MNKKLFSRLVLFIIYVWFGLLKVFGTSAANPLVASLLHKTLPFIQPHDFFIFLGIFETILGILFLIPQCTKLAKILFSIHMVTTFLPLFVLTGLTWQSYLTPSLEGQYIIKNLALIAVVLHL